MSRLLTSDGQPVALGGRAFDTLLTLLRHRGQLVSRGVLMDTVWPDADVEENNLSVQVNFLRKAIGERYIRTVPGHGYCFVPDPDRARTEHASEAAQRPALPTNLQTNLPKALKPLIGRHIQREQLAQWLRREPLVSVLGPAGIGKTLLMQHVLRDLEPEFPHGVCFVDLSQVPGRGDVQAAVAASLGTQATPMPAPATPVAQLAQLEMVLALDNAEHVLEAVAQLVADIGECAPKVKVVVTTQARLKLPHEKVLALNALEIPSAGTALAQALAYGALALFASCARAASSQFELTDADIAPAIELCRALDGLPLAIELAAWRAPKLGVVKLGESMASRLWVLKDQRRKVPQRQQSMRAALQWSHDLLNEGERAAFRRMAVVCGSLELDVLLKILVGEGEDWETGRWQALDVLMVLVDRSLVDVVSGRGNQPRYRLLETPKAFARELLQASPEHNVLAQRHSEVIAGELGRRYLRAAYGDVSRSAWNEDNQDDYPDASAAMDWATRHARADLVAQLAPALLLLTPDADLSASRRHYSLCMNIATTGEDALARFLALDGCTWQWPSGSTSRHQLVTDLLQAADNTAHLPDVDKRRYIAQCKYVANLAMQQAVGVQQLQQMLEQARRAEDPGWPPALRRTRCIAEIQLARRLGDAGAAYLQSLAYREINARAGIAPYFADVAIFEAAMLAGRVADAVDAATRALQSVSGTRDLQLETLVRAHLAAAHMIGGDAAEGMHLLTVVLQQVTPESVVFPYLLDYVALGAARSGQWQFAAQLFGAATTTLQARGLMRWAHHKQAAELTASMVTPHLATQEWEALQASGAKLPVGDLLSAFLGTRQV